MTAPEPRYLIDTNSCIYLFTAEYDELRRRVSACPDGAIAMSAVTLAELAHGSARGLLPSVEALALLVRQIPALPFDAGAANAYAQLPFVRGNFDRLIAAHALALGCTVISRNLRDFGSIDGLKVEDWTQ